MIEITKWEYMDFYSYFISKHNYNAVFNKDPEGYSKKSNSEILNELGKQGWEVVGLDTSKEIEGRPNFYLKRPCGRLKMIEKVNGQEINPE